MDIFSFAMLSIEEQQQAVEKHVTKEKRRAVDQAMAPAEEHANATRAQEEAERKEHTQAQDKEPRSSDNSSTIDPVQELAKSIQVFQQ